MIPHPEKAYKGGEDAFFISPKKDMFGGCLCSPLYPSIPAAMHRQSHDYATCACLRSHAFQFAVDTAVVAGWGDVDHENPGCALACNTVFMAIQFVAPSSCHICQSGLDNRVSSPLGLCGHNSNLATARTMMHI